MDEKQIHADIAVLKEKTKNNDLQVKRCISHIKSEQRVTSNISKRVDTLQRSNDKLQDAVENIEKTLDERYERIQNTLDEKKESHRWNWGMIIQIISALAMWATIFLMKK